ncbi:hypothetical protein ACFOY4_17705 [Actinomadura syzygii]|uniref:Lipoprotein n=1 Tax=Actinomadura syzygii TaxID=1427538 RepID=A0A5D0TXI8_9ACTN|nr:hypothetical protein [Actinomadura syzygii]TYC11031.1 hypothetical protein FXF65_29110 [Actinomadura syzygii]
MGPRHHLGLLRPVLLCAAALALPLAAGCSAKSGASGEKDAKPASIQRLAEQTGCALTGKRKVKDLEQGNCKTAQGRYVLLSFTTDQGMNAWLDEAKPWGGAYLVGPRWVAVSEDKTLTTLRKDLGGEIVYGAGHDMGGMNHG